MWFLLPMPLTNLSFRSYILRLWFFSHSAIHGEYFMFIAIAVFRYRAITKPCAESISRKRLYCFVGFIHSLSFIVNGLFYLSPFFHLPIFLMRCIYGTILRNLVNVYSYNVAYDRSLWKNVLPASCMDEPENVPNNYPLQNMQQNNRETFEEH